MRSKTIITHTDYRKGVVLRWCLKCNLHLDEKGEIDQDFYTARQYFEFMAVPLEMRCDHMCERPDTREDLLKKIDEARHDPFDWPKLMAVLKDIVKAMKI